MTDGGKYEEVKKDREYYFIRRSMRIMSLFSTTCIISDKNMSERQKLCAAEYAREFRIIEDDAARVAKKQILEQIRVALNAIPGVSSA